WVQSTGLETGGGNGDVHGLSGELFFACLFFEYLVNAREVLFCLTARHVDKPSSILALSFRQGSQRLACLGNKALVPQMSSTCFLQLVEVGCCIKSGDCFCSCGF